MGLMILFFQHSFAGGKDDSNIRFIENKGQWEERILFAADIPSGRLFLEKDRLTYKFYDNSSLHEILLHPLTEEERNTPINCHAFSIIFPNSNPFVEIQGNEKAEQYHNYFIGNDPSKWASRAGLYGSVTYSGLFEGIDFVIYGKENSIKYDFIVSPGADPSKISMLYDGLDGTFLRKGSLFMKTSLFSLQDEAPVAFEGSGNEIQCRFTLNNNTAGFEFPEGYDHTKELIIDPTMIFSTYTGSTADNFGFTATYDDDGNLYGGGIVYGNGYPISNGAYQANFAGAFDIGITKFGPTGSLLYSTFIGGSSADQPHSLVVDPQGNLCVFGRTNSSNYPTTSSAYSNTNAGGFDLLVSKLNSSGTSLVASTYVGGSLNDGLSVTNTYTQNSIKYNYGDDARGEIISDASGNVYIAACTQSNNFPVTSGSFQNNIGSGQDGCVFKMNADLSSLVWSTYLGGGGNDAAYSLKLDNNDGVFVTGGTASTDFPTTPGTVSPSAPGGIDGFISHLNNTGTSMIASTYIGNNSYNQCFFIELDNDQEVYVVGQKLGTWPVTPGVWSTAQGGQFIQKLNYNLSSVLLSTQFGTSNSVVNISPTAFLVDVCEYIYVSGWGGTTNFSGTTTNMPITSNAFQSTTDGSDLYILVLEKDMASLDYGTYIGGSVSNEHVDGGTSRFNKYAEIYQAVCAGCWGNSDFPMVNAYSPTNNSGFCNLAVFKMELTLPGILADFDPVPDTGGCAPHTVLFDNQSTGGNIFFWNFGDPGSGPANTSTLYSPTHTYNTPGVYNIMLVAIDSNSCNVVDTTWQTIYVFPQPVATVTPDTSICFGDNINLVAGGGTGFQWSPGGMSGSSVVVSPTTTTTYTVIVTSPVGCKDTAEVTVTVLPIPNANAGPDQTICLGDTCQLAGSGGTVFSWTPSGSLNGSNTQNPLAFPTTTTDYILEVGGVNGCTDYDTVTVNVSIVTADAGVDIDLCIGSSVQLNATGGTGYIWTPSTGLSSTTISNPIANPTSSTTYYVEVSNNLGCKDIDSIDITIHPLPNIDAGPDFIMCQLDTTQIFATGGLTYVWTPGITLSNPNIANPFAFPMSNTTYIVQGTDQWGCVNYDTLNVEVLPAPVAQAWGAQTICEDSSLQVFASGGVTYSWLPASVFDFPNSQNPTATLTQTTELVVIVTAANGCDNRDTLLIPVIPTPTPTVNWNDTVCLGHSIKLWATGCENYVWSTGQTGSPIVVTPDSSQTYYLTGFDGDCPSPPYPVYVTVLDDLPFADFSVTPDSGWIPLTSFFTNQSINSTAWNWYFGDGATSTLFSPEHMYTDTGRFEVALIAFSASGCPDTAYKHVIVTADFTIYVPNIFTPNGDGINDFFSTPWIGIKEFHIMLFDRWGTLIYESNDPDFKWPGTYKGLPCQEEVYTYVIEAQGWLGEKVKRAGTVMLVR